MYFFISNFAALEIIFVSVTVPKLLANLIGASRKISFTGCFVQMYAFLILGVGECYLLVVMALDRDLAINNPLHYSSIMNKVLYIELAVAPWIMGLVVPIIPIIFTAKLEFCGPNEVDHFFCDLAPIQNIACSNPLGLILYKTHELNKTVVTEFVLLAFCNLQNLQILLFVFILLAFISCVMENSAILLLVKYSHSLHTPMYFFISNFAALEIIFVSVTVPKLLANLIGASRKISFTGCFVQMYAFLILGVGECYLLVVMALDRDLAINNPLHYSSIMNKVLYIELAVAPWIMGLVVPIIPIIFTAKLEFCGPNEVDHFFCDLAPIQNIACSNPLVSSLVTSSAAVFGSLLPFLIILAFYIHIIVAISKIKSTTGKQKAFSTCSSHLIVASMFYCSAIIVYIRSKSSRHDKFLALLYTVIIPAINPFIYTFRNNDVKTALRKLKLLRILG
ncbi:olfactory receptor 10A7-like [Dendropsophus ebraccatus]|uniref:olfactory receptor 10A7-like n=1 Tax=Dendropsophus ebraccatus TaxID=150705 RepID=UPI00383142C4